MSTVPMGTPTVTFADGKTYKLDQHGFLDPPEQWDDEFAIGMAERVGIHGGLTQEHWDFIRYLRRRFTIEKTVPVVVLACADNNLRLNRLRTLFPAGYHRGACKIAGINHKFMYEHNIWLTYESFRLLKTEYDVTPAGFLEDFADWNQRFAYQIASDWDLPDGMTDRHWEVIDYLRDFYSKSGGIPNIYETCRELQITLDDMLALFPEGYRRGACRAAGLPYFS